ncbi:MAG: hypothetical protein MZW92_57940 [Comamonadaceae bacterium]|nr:hypothetical protein [Comamonadaceae bacterium]
MLKVGTDEYLRHRRLGGTTTHHRPPAPTTTLADADAARPSSAASRWTSRRRSTSRATIMLHVHPSISRGDREDQADRPRRRSATTGCRWPRSSDQRDRQHRARAATARSSPSAA